MQPERLRTLSRVGRRAGGRAIGRMEGRRHRANERRGACPGGFLFTCPQTRVWDFLRILWEDRKHSSCGRRTGGRSSRDSSDARVGFEFFRLAGGRLKKTSSLPSLEGSRFRKHCANLEALLDDCFTSCQGQKIETASRCVDQTNAPNENREMQPSTWDEANPLGSSFSKNLQNESENV